MIQNILILGEPASGKTSSLENLKDQENWIYINTEGGKQLPFKNTFSSIVINDPDKLVRFLSWLSQNRKNPEELRKIFNTKISEPKGIILDSISELMKLYQAKYILDSSDKSKTFENWDRYTDYVRKLVQVILPSLELPYIMLSHTILRENIKTGMADAVADLKGVIGKTGLEAYFTTVVAAKCVPLQTLETYGAISPENITISEEDRMLGTKYVFQLKNLPDQPEKRLRGFRKVLEGQTPFINNDVQWILDKQNEIVNG